MWKTDANLKASLKKNKEYHARAHSRYKIYSLHVSNIVFSKHLTRVVRIKVCNAVFIHVLTMFIICCLRRCILLVPWSVASFVVVDVIDKVFVEFRSLKCFIVFLEFMKKCVIFEYFHYRFKKIGGKQCCKKFYTRDFVLQIECWECCVRTYSW